MRNPLHCVDCNQPIADDIAPGDRVYVFSGAGNHRRCIGEACSKCAAKAKADGMDVRTENAK